MKKTGYILLTVLISIVHILPFYLLLTTSFKPANDFSSKWLFPGRFYFGNFTNAWKNANLGQAFINNIIITACSLLLIIVIGGDRLLSAVAVPNEAEQDDLCRVYFRHDRTPANHAGSALSALCRYRRDEYVLGHRPAAGHIQHADYDFLVYGLHRLDPEGIG